MVCIGCALAIYHIIDQFRYIKDMPQYEALGITKEFVGFKFILQSLVLRSIVLG